MEQEYSNGLFIQSQEDLTEEINLRLFNKPKTDKIEKEISRMLEEMK